MSETVEPEVIEPVETSLTDDIRAAFQESTGKTPAGAETEAPEGETETERADRLRDERGRFAKAEETAAAPETQEAPAAEAPKGIEPPATWPEAQKAAFAKVPPELQEFLLKRHQETEADYTRKTSQIAAFRRDFEPVAQLFEPHRELMREKNYTPGVLVKGWIETEGALMNAQTAPEAAARIIRGYSIPPEAVMQALGWRPPQAAPGAEGEPPPPQQQAQIPPELAQMLHGVMSKVDTWEQRQQQQQQWQHEQATARVIQEIERFKTEIGADGRALRPHFAEVEEDMAMLAQMAVKRGGDTPPLQELYDQAVWANPITRARVLADQSAAQEAQRRAQETKARDEARAKAVKAQRASAPVTGAPRSGHAEQRNGRAASVADDLRETLAELRG